jgi:N-hydroxyarylamine O-acetyltransferase
VPFDNLQKRAWFADPSRPLPGGDAVEFFTRYLDEGSGGTCWATSRALWSLLVSLGFPAKRTAGTMMGGLGAPPPEIMLTHGTVTVRFDGIDHLVDTHMLTSKPLPLVPGVDTAVEGTFAARATKGDLGDALFRVFFPPFNGRMPEMSCLIQRLEVDDDFYRDRHERSRTAGPFNTHAYVRRQTVDGHRLVVLGKRIEASPDATMNATPLATRVERDAHLVSMGYASTLVARVPEDDPPPPA